MPRTLIIFLLTLFVFTSFAFERSNTPAFYTTYNNHTSFFEDGIIYRIEIDKTGIYELPGSWLTENTSFSNGSVFFKDISLHGIFDGQLDHNTEYESTEHMQQIAVQVEDDGNGMYDSNDKIRFYAEGPDQVRFDANGLMIHSKNPFATSNFVFLKVATYEIEHNVNVESMMPMPTNPADKYWYSAYYHEDLTNLLDNFISTQGSGQKWYGTELSNRESILLNDKFALPQGGLLQAIVETRLAGRSNTTEQVILSVGGQQKIKNFSPVNTSDIEALYARDINFTESFDTIAEEDEIKLEFFRIQNDARAWLDYMTIQGWGKATYQKRQIALNNSFIMDQPEHDGLIISSSQTINVWDISNPYLPISKEVNRSANGTIIKSSQTQLERYIAFEAGDLFTPLSVQEVANRNILEDGNVDFIILSTAATLNSAQNLAKHRLEHDQIESAIIDPQEVYDVYSSGKVDPTAIRNFARDLYHSYADFKYLLLMGDASFDYRHINKNHPADNLIPTFETFNSLDPLLSFPTDDYYAMLDDGENGLLRGDLDIAVGRITVSNEDEAAAVVNKIISYDSDDEEVALWKTRAVFLADDEDNNLHINDADVIAVELASQHPLINQEKIYFDAFRQESTPGGNRYPTATQALNRSVEKGALVINYLGHGGPNGWAQERVLKIDDINNWTNFDRLPLIVTATCSFTGFDDPSLSSAGEEALLKENGGALALFTTVRSVFASKNFQLTRSVFRQLFVKEDNAYLTIGEIMRRSKNDNPSDNTNARKFFLIGDPTIRLAIPALNVQTDEINGNSFENNDEAVDVSALDKVSITGSIRNDNGELINDFNGIVEVVVFDKAANVQTFANDQRSIVKSFKSQQNIIYKGRTRIAAGTFEISFVVPLDIDYSVGNAKISYFALGESGIDAAGFSEKLKIGGDSVDPVTDDEGPEVNIFINNRLFENGDIVPSSNKVIVDLNDDFGINISNSAIGHEITAVLDGDSRTTIFLNDFFQSSTENSKGGNLEFNLLNLETGHHELRVRAFDIANNVGESTISFEVSDIIERSISDVIANPNPITNQTEFTILHDLLDGAVELDLSVLDFSGKLLDQKRYGTVSEDGRIKIIWQPLFANSGVFVCHFTLMSVSTGESTPSYSEKVVVLK